MVASWRKGEDLESSTHYEEELKLSTHGDEEECKSSIHGNEEDLVSSTHGDEEELE